MPESLIKMWGRVKEAGQLFIGLVVVVFVSGVLWSDISHKHEEAFAEITQLKADIKAMNIQQEALKIKQEAIIRLEEGQKYLIQSVDEIKKEINLLRVSRKP